MVIERPARSVAFAIGNIPSSGAMSPLMRQISAGLFANVRTYASCVYDSY